MSYQVVWGRSAGNATITGEAELDAVLDMVGVTPNGDPYNVSIVAPDVPITGDSTVPAMIEICIGHPERSYVYHVGADGSSAWGYEPGLEPRTGIHVNYGGVVTEAWPEMTRVTPDTARQAAREFIARQAQRPNCLSWDELDEE